MYPKPSQEPRHDYQTIRTYLGRTLVPKTHAYIYIYILSYYALFDLSDDLLKPQLKFNHPEKAPFPFYISNKPQRGHSYREHDKAWLHTTQ